MTADIVFGLLIFAALLVLFLTWRACRSTVQREQAYREMREHVTNHYPESEVKIWH